jgi:hypothetical protein
LDLREQPTPARKRPDRQPAPPREIPDPRLEEPKLKRLQTRGRRDPPEVAAHGSQRFQGAIGLPAAGHRRCAFQLEEGGVDGFARRSGLSLHGV